MIIVLLRSHLFLLKEILVVDEIWRPEEVKELQLAKLKRVQILAGNPCPTFQLARDQVRVYLSRFACHCSRLVLESGACQVL